MFVQRVPGSVTGAVLALLVAGQALAQPSLFGFTPTSGPPGTSVRVMGANFDPAASATRVEFGGAASHAVEVDASGGWLTAVVPDGAATGPITVTAGLGTASSAGLATPAFTVTDGPVLVSFYPRSGVAGGGQRLRLYGSGLRDVTEVQFAGGVTVPAGFPFTFVQVDASGSVVDTIVPAGAQSGPVVVVTPRGSATTAALEPSPPDGSGSFVIGAPPVLEGFYPASGPAGTLLFVSGVTLRGATAASIGGVAAAIRAVDDTGTSLQLEVPAGTAGGPVAVETAAGAATWEAEPPPEFVVDVVPRIDSVYPATAEVGSLVTIQGANLGRPAIERPFPLPPIPSENVVTFGAQTWSVEEVSESRDWLQARVTGGSAGSGPVRVATDGGTADSPAPFTVSSVPVVTGFQPGSGLPGARITVLGTSLRAATGVAFAGVPADWFTLRTDDAGTWVSAVVPATAVTGPITVTTPGGSATSTASFVVSPSTPCGNGVVDAGETCDDGNRAAGDCCTPWCALEGAGAACADDGNGCTDDACDAAGACTHPPRAGACDDGVFCNGTDSCEGGDCRLHAGDPCAGGAECQDVCDEAARACRSPAGAACAPDADLCTADACDGAGTCTHVLGPSAACSVPVRGGAAKLLMVRKPDPADDRLEWTFAHGQAVAAAGLGDPRTTTAYGFCLFDGTGALLWRAEVPPGGTCDGNACWKVNGSRVAYKDGERRVAGLQHVRAAAGKAGKTKARVDGKGAGLALPALPVTSLPLRAELHSAAGACWGASYGHPGHNAADRFQAKSDGPGRAKRPGKGARP